jgi:hypothetical protein
MRDDVCTYATFTLNLDHREEVIGYDSLRIQVVLHLVFRMRRSSFYRGCLEGYLL